MGLLTAACSLLAWSAGQLTARAHGVGRRRRLDETAAAEDVPRLASLAMNCYMNMMLDGTLHCDPQSGNLLHHGKLCIRLGLVSRLTWPAPLAH